MLRPRYYIKRQWSNTNDENNRRAVVRWRNLLGNFQHSCSSNNITKMGKKWRLSRRRQGKGFMFSLLPIAPFNSLPFTVLLIMIQLNQREKKEAEKEKGGKKRLVVLSTSKGDESASECEQRERWLCVQLLTDDPSTTTATTATTCGGFRVYNIIVIAARSSQHKTSRFLDGDCCCFVPTVLVGNETKNEAKFIKVQS